MGKYVCCDITVLTTFKCTVVLSIFHCCATIACISLYSLKMPVFTVFFILCSVEKSRMITLWFCRVYPIRY